MQRNVRSYCRSGKSFWETLARRGMHISPGVASITTIMAAFQQQSGLQTAAADVNIRVQKNVPRIAEAG